MPPATLAQYNAAIQACQAVFEKKTKDYGTAWRVLRLPSLTDQLLIKARRIRALQEQPARRVAEGMDVEFVGLVNYGLMALLQLELPPAAPLELPYAELAPLYEKAVAAARGLLGEKNHDYQEAWRAMRLGSITDIILMKLLRIKRLEDLSGPPLVSEGVAAGYRDIVNYAVFALIMLGYGGQ